MSHPFPTLFFKMYVKGEGRAMFPRLAEIGIGTHYNPPLKSLG
jgi:hypothetical protein